MFVSFWLISDLHSVGHSFCLTSLSRSIQHLCLLIGVLVSWHLKWLLLDKYFLAFLLFSVSCYSVFFLVSFLPLWFYFVLWETWFPRSLPSFVEFSFPMAVFFYFYECDSLSHLMATVNLMFLKLFLFPGHSAGFSSNCWSVYFTKRNWGQWFEDCISESLGKHFQNIHSQFNSPSFNAAAPGPKESVTVSKNCV